MASIRSAIVKVMGGGRVTIPSEIRDIESIKEGDYLEISIKKIERSSKKHPQPREEVKSDG